MFQLNFDISAALTADTQNSFDKALAALEAPLAEWREAPLPHFALPEKTDDLPALTEMAADMVDAFARVIVLGTGGSSLGAQVLAQIHGWGTPSGQLKGPQLIFADNLDATSLAQLLAPEHLAETGFLVVSKSGGTAETMMQLCCVLPALEAARLEPARHIFGISGTGDVVLRRLAHKYGLRLLDHEADIGGRFAVLSNVGLLPALLAGCDIGAIRSGARENVAVLFDNGASGHAAAQGAALQYAHMQAGRMVSVLMPYADRLDRLTFWFRQLWAESLGKSGSGSLPANALGPVDQHSQVQLYLDGPDDKLFTLISHATCGVGPKVPASFGADPALGFMVERTIGDLVDAEARATRDTLIAHGRPVRHMQLPDTDEAIIGALLMHFMLETIMAAALMGIDAFDQPAVEDGKKKAMQYMLDMAT